MSLRRLRRGELVLLVALVLLVVGLSVRWFDVRFPGTGTATFTVGGRSGWATLGHPWIEFVILGLLGWVAVLVTAARGGGGRPTYAAVVTGVWAVLGTFLVLLLTFLRSVAFPPDGGDALGGISYVFGTVDRLNQSPDVVPAGGAWLGLGALVLGLVGAWMAMADDRTTAAENRAIEPPQVRDVPPLRPAPAVAPAPDAEPPTAGSDVATPPEPS